MARFWPCVMELHQKRASQLSIDVLGLTAIHQRINIPDELPPKDLGDKLLASYLQTAGTIYRIVDWQDFKRKYDSLWQRADSDECEFIVFLFLVFVVGSASINEKEGRLSRSKALRWMSLARMWRNPIVGVERCTMPLLQVDFLLLIGRKFWGLGSPSDHIASANLVRTAITMGLHGGSSQDSNLTADEDNLRRHLWYAVLELDAQCSLESGVEPTYTGMWTALPPRPDAHHSDLQHWVEQVTGKPWCLERETCPQIALRQSLPIRLQIVQQLNQPQFDLRYETACELTEKLKAVAGWTPVSGSNSTEITSQFLSDYTTLVLNTVLLSLHWTFAIQLQPKYSYSRNLCVIAALKILKQLCPSRTETRLQILVQRESFIFENNAFPAALFLCADVCRGASQFDPGDLLEIPSLKNDVIGALRVFIAVAEQRVALIDYSEVAYVLPAVALVYIRHEEWRSMTNDEHVQYATAQIVRKCLDLVQVRVSVSL
ncbi:hypothetical protein BJY00DRAFT_185880 [Aspergillus carlsbadensis]|nr:hypothetical protein BJY00DRAFT_185880 [Aspergillus carlsbadensis]